MPEEVFIIAIVSVVMSAVVAMQWIKSRSSQENKGLSEEVSRKLKTIDKLEERVRILEKIVTNKKANLAEEIEGL
jgi:hypothetical protein